jgi:hypothetical protein
VEEPEKGAQEHVTGQLVPAQRRPYRSPSLVEYGSVSKLTEGVGGSMPDSGGRINRSCL